MVSASLFAALFESFSVRLKSSASSCSLSTPFSCDASFKSSGLSGVTSMGVMLSAGYGLLGSERSPTKLSSLPPETSLLCRSACRRCACSCTKARILAELRDVIGCVIANPVIGCVEASVVLAASSSEQSASRVTCLRASPSAGAPGDSGVLDERISSTKSSITSFCASTL